MQQPAALAPKAQMMLRAIVRQTVSLQIRLVVEAQMVQATYRYYSTLNISPVDAQGQIRPLGALMRTSTSNREGLFAFLLNSGLFVFINNRALDPRFFHAFREYALLNPDHVLEMFQALRLHDEAVLRLVKSRPDMLRETVLAVATTADQGVEQVLASNEIRGVDAILPLNTTAVWQTVQSNPLYMKHVVENAFVYHFDAQQLTELFQCID